MKQIKIKRIYTIERKKQILKDKKLWGYVDYYHKIIYLKKGNSEENSLYHELAHILIYELCAKSNVYKIRCFLERFCNSEGFIEFFAGLLKNAFTIKYYKK